jgi:catechol 2,3-dioxygenase
MTLTAVQAGFYLHHLSFESLCPERLALFYSNVMDMDFNKQSDTEWRCEGPGRRMVFVPGENKKMAYAGMACRDREGLEALRSRVLSENIKISDSSSSYFEDGAFSLKDPDGNLLCFGIARFTDNKRKAIKGPIQHLTFASFDVERFRDFYCGKLGFRVTDQVLHDDGSLATCFTTSNHEHHTIACFKSDRKGVDHHSYEAGSWDYIRDWCDHFSDHDVSLMWGPGRHGPGNNLFVFIEDPDDNWIEVSAELEVVCDREIRDWPQAERTLNLWGNAILRS